MIEAIIFDMDGVLFDTEKFYYDRRKLFLEQKGISIDHISPKDFVGGRLDHVWQKILIDQYDSYDIEALEKEYISYKEAHRAPYEELIFSDVKNVLQAFKDAGIRLALASNTEPGDIHFALSSVGIKDYFPTILSGSSFSEGKPHPAIYLAASQQITVAKEKILVIEDSTKGIAAGKAAGLTVWAIRDKWFGSDQSQADAIIDNLTAIKERVLGE